MSKIIKAAHLKVLVPNESQTVISSFSQSQKPVEYINGTILEGSNLLRDAQRKAEELIAQAEKEANILFTEKKEELETLRLQAKESGYEIGYKEGLLKGKTQVLEEATDLLTLLENTVKEAVQARASALSSLEDDFLKFSLILADKIVKKSVHDDVSWLSPIIIDAVQALGSVQQILIRLNPVDYALINEQKDHLGLDMQAKLQFESDFSITQGGCLIESDNGLIDARIEKRLGKIANSLLEVLYNDNE